MRWTIALLAAAFAAAAFANDVGQIKTVKGTVHVERDGQRLAAKPGMGVRQADTLVTGADGAVGVTFLDNSRVSAGPAACSRSSATASTARRTRASSTRR